MTPPDRRPFFSIVVCSWNSAAFIRDCVQSVLDQTFASYEIVFVDGGSTDGTLEYIASVPAAKTVLNDVRGGIANAMNAGIRAAHGQVIAHLHSDDYYYGPRTLERVHGVFAEHPAAAWVYGWFKNDVDGIVKDPPYSARSYSRAALLRRNIVPHCATFVRSEVFASLGGFDPAYRLAMDYDMWLRISARHAPVQIEDCLGVFRRHSASATTVNRLKSFNEDFRARFVHGPAWHWPEFGVRYLVRRFRDLRSPIA